MKETIIRFNNRREYYLDLLMHLATDAIQSQQFNRDEKEKIIESTRMIFFKMFPEKCAEWVVLYEEYFVKILSKRLYGPLNTDGN